MPITTWKVPHDADYRWHPREEDKTTTYVGCVVATYTDVKRVMSDIYSDVYYAIVWDEAEATFKHVQYSSAFECDARRGVATVDADAGMLLRHKAKLRAEAKRREDEDLARRQKLANVRREAEHNRPVSGKRMIVFKGRKVPLGTTGLVFWVRDGRIGLRTSDRKDNSGKWADIVWVNESNLKNVEPFV
jgi:hypothetical protein